MPVRLVQEASQSRSGKHVERKLALVLGRDGKLREAGGQVRGLKPLYAKGEAKEILVDLKEGELGVQVRLVRGLKGRVKGFIALYDREGREVYRASLRRRKLRPGRGSTEYHSLVEQVVESLGIAKHLRKYKLP
ncbi:MAG: hypothetical protein NZ902_03460 [Acidilobaceae archaeon]|nr:hypothetical protein [Acidilobaceae archaeon]MCX8165213.1 hypothetical protein [Acidilobaceae archaeon]MDW7974271.1 hypothetical protein [Sulfolobales archaeon]